MDTQAFEYLYIHANCIAELALVRTVAALMAQADAPADVSPPPSRPSTGVDAQPVVEDESALAGLPFFGELSADDLARHVARLEADMARGDVAPETTAGGLPPFGVAIGCGDIDPAFGPPDVGLYLDQAYASRAALQSRIADCRARADLAAIAATLATLPAGHAPLAAPMPASELERWLDVYESLHEGLATLVAEIRRLEPIG